MGKVVAAVAMSHAPGALGFPETVSDEVRAKTESASRALGESLEAAKPDVIIAFLDDHFENFFRNLMPQLAIGVADSHVGPADQWMTPLRIPKKHIFPGAPDVAEQVLHSLVEQGFDTVRAGSVEYGNNFLMPWLLMRPALPNVAIIPVFINVFTPPLIKYNRAYAFGEAIRTAVDALPQDLRVAFLATGGLSHWPPYWNPTYAPPEDKFLQRMKRYQTEGKPYLKQDPNLFTDFDEYEIEQAARNEYPLGSKHPLVNDTWDQLFLEKFSKGDSQWMKDLQYDYVEEEAGHGGHEILNWVALMGSMRGASSELVLYEPVIEWVCGMAYVDYKVQEETEA